MGNPLIKIDLYTLATSFAQALVQEAASKPDTMVHAIWRDRLAALALIAPDLGKFRCYHEGDGRRPEEGAYWLVNRLNVSPRRGRCESASHAQELLTTWLREALGLGPFPLSEECTEPGEMTEKDEINSLWKSQPQVLPDRLWIKKQDMADLVTVDIMVVFETKEGHHIPAWERIITDPQNHVIISGSGAVFSLDKYDAEQERLHLVNITEEYLRDGAPWER